MGKGSKAQTVGYKYYLGMHLGLCHGPIDKITRLSVDDRIAWQGSNTGGTVNVNAETLFGGEKREGGVSGAIDIEMGGPAQGKNSYLVSKLGAIIPAYRGIVGLIFRQCYLGNNPYLKPWSARGQRIHVRQDGIAQWYDEKAEVRSGGEGGWQDDFSYADNADLLSQWTEVDPNGRFVWTLDDHPSTGQPSIRCQVLNNLSGTYQTTLSRTIGGLKPGSSYTVRASLYAVGPSVQPNNVLIQDWLNYIAVANASGEVTVTIPINRNGGTAVDTYYWVENIRIQPVGDSIDMNAAHIIRECLTDPDWGMGYTDEDIDETSFVASADLFHSEQLGLSLLWDRESKIEDFVEVVKRHVDTALFVSRKTGKFVLKPIRGDYVEADLITLDESNIVSIDEPNRVSFGELTNSVTAKYWDASTGKDASVTVSDTALVQQQGVVINAPVQYPGFTNGRNATIAAQRDLRVLSSPLLSCTITANSDAKDLEIGDVFKFSWNKWGIVELVMRVTDISYGTGRNNRVKINCTQDVFDTETNVAIIVPGGSWEDPSTPPSAPPAQLATEAPYWELVQALGQADIDNKLLTHPEVGYVIAAAARSSGAINAALYTDNGTGYEDVGAFDFAPFGSIVEAIDKTTTAFVLENYEDLDEVVIGSHLQVGDELMRVDSLNVDTGAITVGRGILDTVPQDHPAGALALFWDAYAGFDPTEYVVGEEVNAKILTISGAGVLPIAEAVPLPVELEQRAARPYAPGDLRLNGERYTPNAIYEGEVTIEWAHRDRLQQTSGNFADALDGNIGPEAGTLYRVQGYVDGVLVHTEDDIAGTSTTWTPEDAGVIKIEVHSKRDGLYSWQAPSHTFINASPRLTEAGDERYTEDGEIRVQED